jgi:hypothetical protein
LSLRRCCIALLLVRVVPAALGPLGVRQHARGRLSVAGRVPGFRCAAPFFGIDELTRAEAGVPPALEAGPAAQVAIRSRIASSENVSEVFVVGPADDGGPMAGGNAARQSAACGRVGPCSPRSSVAV